MAGATTVILTRIDGVEVWLALGQELGASRVVNAIRENCLETLLDLTGGRKADRVIDTTGAVAALWQGVEMTCKGGVYENMGGFPAATAISIYPDYLLRNKIDMRFSHMGVNCFQTAREIIPNKRFPLYKLVTRPVPLERIQEALSRLLTREGDGRREGGYRHGNVTRTRKGDDNDLSFGEVDHRTYEHCH